MEATMPHTFYDVQTLEPSNIGEWEDWERVRTRERDSDEGMSQSVDKPGYDVCKSKRIKYKANVLYVNMRK